VHILLKNQKAAQLDFEKAIRINPDNAGIRHNFGRFLMQIGLIDESGRELDAALNLSPHDDKVMLSFARLRLSQGRISEAKILLSRARELRPDNQSVEKLLNEVDSRTQP
jgi:Tfp pilus assembly protein PilF